MYLFVGLILNLSHEKNSEHEVILDSTLITLCISLGCVFLGVLVFTRSTHLAIIVMTIVMTIVVGLLFFMVIATWLKSPKVFSLDEFSIAVIFYTEWDLYWVYSLMIIVLYILNQIWQVWQMYLVACFPSIVKLRETAQFCSDHELVHWRHRSPIPHRFCGFRGGLLPPFVTVSENHTTSGIGKTWNLKLEFPNQWILHIRIIRNKFESDLLEMMVVLRSHKYHSCHITDVEEKDDEEEEVPNLNTPRGQTQSCIRMNVSILW